MINLKDKLKLEGYGLLLQNNELTITKTLENEYIVIEEDLNVLIKENVNVNILDLSHEKNINITILNGGYLNYQIVNSNSSKRTINNYGKLDICEICLKETITDLTINLLNEAANAEVNLLAISNNFNQTFNQMIVHKNPKTISNISNFGVAFSKSNIVFDTSGKIEKGMSKSKCVQLSKGIIMDDNAKITSKPILLIDEFDVIANHGASIGKMSDESLFYLMSRGLSKKEAFLLVLNGIINPFIGKILDEELKQNIIKELTFLIKE